MEGNLRSGTEEEALAFAKEAAYQETRLMLGIIRFLEQLDDAENPSAGLENWLRQPVMRGSQLTGQEALERLFE